MDVRAFPLNIAPRIESILPRLGYDQGDEYDNLLQYVADEAVKAKRKTADDDDDENHYTRPWYAPWKKIKVKSEKESEVCRTPMLQ